MSVLAGLVVTLGIFLADFYLFSGAALSYLGRTAIPGADYAGSFLGFIGATALLGQGYRPEDAIKAQALNGQLVFGMMALGSIGPGVMLQTLGWQAINVLAIPVATGALAMLAWGGWRAEEKEAFQSVFRRSGYRLAGSKMRPLNNLELPF